MLLWRQLENVVEDARCAAVISDHFVNEDVELALLILGYLPPPAPASARETSGRISLHR
jgi:hypothetical protein